jgi:hypothetical protein
MADFDTYHKDAANAPCSNPDIPEGWYFWECLCGAKIAYDREPKYCAECGIKFKDVH